MMDFFTGAVRARSRGGHPCSHRPIFVRRNLAGTNFSGTNVVGSNLVGTNLAGTYPAGSNLAGTNLVRTNVFGTNLVGIKVPGTNLARTYLAGTNLVGTNLVGPLKVCPGDEHERFPHAYLEDPYVRERFGKAAAWTVTRIGSSRKGWVYW